jgi:hypothetical protein
MLLSHFPFIWTYSDTYRSINCSFVLMSNDAMCKVVGIDIYTIKIFGGVVRALDDVKRVLDLKKNLVLLDISVSNGYNWSYEDDQVCLGNVEVSESCRIYIQVIREYNCRWSCCSNIF